MIPHYVEPKGSTVIFSRVMWGSAYMFPHEMDEKGKIFKEFVGPKIYQNQFLYSNSKNFAFDQEYPEQLKKSLTIWIQGLHVCTLR